MFGSMSIKQVLDKLVEDSNSKFGEEFLCYLNENNKKLKDEIEY